MTTARRGLVAALALLAGCGLAERPSVDTAFPADGEGTVLLGDSIMFSATEPILAELPRSTVDAVPGRTMVSPALSDAGLPRVEVLAASEPDRWVVELGTNDAFTVGSVTDDVVLADLDVLLGSIDATASDGEACVWWVLPHVAAPTTRRGRRASSRVIGRRTALHSTPPAAPPTAPRPPCRRSSSKTDRRRDAASS